ncbi:preprotein translocase subunit YajC [Desulfonispora thiosulfatigenes DSM 11270]|uniref:Preprotein translocase subunit YajC n=1 Tax=Desulfonispora thiosulfatigenes DSM 11270 TaxID=656914 RepID=A0A1W1VS49_DESTI|nr:preprotein translocase subunit YajC [Desulfonispora thiosulfatigenes]SMB95714.1 preprotein translocase subunit YajC [Desulfonispora thiosulfatigenes DSM 11270]
MSQQLLMLGAFFLIIYFTMIRPQQKQQKQRKTMLSDLRKGDKVVTIGGIEGEIKSIKDDRIVLKVAHNVNLTMLKTSVGQVVTETTNIQEESNDEQALIEEK